MNILSVLKHEHFNAIFHKRDIPNTPLTISKKSLSFRAHMHHNVQLCSEELGKNIRGHLVFFWSWLKAIALLLEGWISQN